MGQDVGGLDLVFPLQRRLDRQDNRPPPPKMHGAGLNQQEALRGLAVGDPVRGENIPERSVLTPDFES